MDEEQLWKLLDSLQGHIRAFDTKAQVALGLDSLLAALIGAEIARGIDLSSWHFDGSTAWLCVFAGCSVISLLASVVFAIRTAVPRLHLKQPRSHFFFCHLVELYGHKFGEAAKSLIALGDDQILQELATQVQTNAIVCDAKSKGCQASLRLMMLSLVFYLMSFVPLGALAYRQTGKEIVTSTLAPDSAVQSDRHPTVSVRK
jgi:hypothetical protein